MRTYKAYVFRGQDPAIIDIKAMSKGIALSDIEDAGGPSTSCLRSWFRGKTKRPQNATIEAAGRALGFRREWRKK
jgi:hypothetical protein